jgi:predicted dehydrogenase
MRFLIAGLGSKGDRHLRWQGGGVQLLRVFTGVLNMYLTVEAAAQIDLCSSNGTTGSVQLNYNHRPAGRQLEIVGSEGTGRWISLETGVQ